MNIFKNHTKIFFAIFLILITASNSYGFDLAVAGKSVFDPIVTLIDDHYGKAIVAIGGAGALIAPGDLRTKAIGFGIGSTLAGLAMAAVKAGFGV